MDRGQASKKYKLKESKKVNLNKQRRLSIWVNINILI